MEKCFKNAFYKNLETHGVRSRFNFALEHGKGSLPWRLGSLFCVSEVGLTACNPAENFSLGLFHPLGLQPHQLHTASELAPRFLLYIAENAVSEKHLVFSFES